MTPEHLLECQEMIEDCSDRNQQLSDWEANFLSSIDERLEEKSYLSDKQISILTRIWDRVTSRG